MALRTTPTIAICLTAALAAGIGLARPGDSDSTADPRYESTGAEGSGAPGPGYGEAGVDDGSVPTAAPDAGGSAAADAPAITIEEFAFAGQTSVAPGSAIAVTNLDGATHTLTSEDGLFHTGPIGRDESVSITAPGEPGEYAFICQIHPSMRGTLVVG